MQCDGFKCCLFHLDCTVVHSKSAICFRSESSFFGSSTTSSQFAGFLSVWLSGVSAPVMHHPFALIRGPRVPFNITAYGLPTPCTHFLWQDQYKFAWCEFSLHGQKLWWACEHFNLLVLISSGLIQLVSAVCWRLIFCRCVLYNGTVLAVMSQSVQVIICIRSAGLQ